MARHEGRACRGPSCIGRFCRDEDGKVSIVSIFAVMAIFGMLGLAANTGRVAREKVELQNAADAAAATTTLWMARSMNAVTTANHLMGEATAVVVLLDGLGGPDFGTAPTVLTRPGIRYQQSLKASGILAPILPIGKAGPAATEADRVVVNRVVELLTADGGKTSVGAALYDAKFTLKFVASMCLVIKTFANLVLTQAISLQATGVGLVPGLFLEGVASLAHLTASGYLGAVAVEWLRLEALEKSLALAAPPLRSAVVGGVLPGLSKYGDAVVGSAGAPGSMNRSIRRSLQDLEQRHRLASLEMVPPVDKLRLPVEREQPPQGTGGQQPHRGWKDDFESPGIREIRKTYERLDDAVGLATSKVSSLIGFAGKLAAGLLNTASGGRPPKWVRDLQKALKGLEELAASRPPLPEAPGSDGFPENPARDPARLPAFDCQAEARSQWARATYPYVDDYRAPIVAWFRSELPLSNAATYFVNWTNRATLVRSFRLRSDAARTHMHVMRDMQPAAKGREPWVTDPRAAGDLFAVVAVATREPAAVWLAPRVFGKPGGRQAAVAGGLLYNANGNRVTAAGASETQPDTGWDTLNWQSPVKAPEWGRGNPTVRSGDPLAAFKSSRPTGPGAAVRLNWQGKLAPVDRGLLGRAQGDEARFILRHERLLHH